MFTVIRQCASIKLRRTFIHQGKYLVTMSKSYQHSDEIERDIIKELTSRLPHRKVVIEIGRKFNRKDIALKLTTYGEVRMNSYRCGDFYDEQLRLFEIFQPTQLPELIAPLDRDVHRKSFNIQKDHCLMVSITENDHVAGTVLILPRKDEEIMIAEEKVNKVTVLSVEKKCNLDTLYSHYQSLIKKALPFVRTQNPYLGRGLCVDPNLKGKGVGAHLELLRLLITWFFSPEILGRVSVGTEEAQSFQVGEIRKMGDEVIATEHNQHVVELIPEEYRTRFMTQTIISRYEYANRHIYYSCLKRSIFNQKIHPSNSKM